MKKIFFAVCSLMVAGSAFAQLDSSTNLKAVNPETVKKVKKKYDLSNRANDHFMLQIGYTNWSGTPDSINTKGFSRSINAYFMFDFPFKSSQNFSAAIGLGIGSDHVFLDKNFANVKGITPTLRFEDTLNIKIKKTKVATTYAEVPLELRFVSNPEKSDKSFKAAIGLKGGLLLRSGTRSKVTEPGTQANYLLKESSKSYFNTTRIVGTARVGYGHFTLFGTYQLTSVLKTGVGPQLRPFTIGLNLSGL